MNFLRKVLFPASESRSEIIDSDGQIEALLTNRAYQYVMDRLNIDRVMPENYRQVFTVRRRELEEYIARHEIKVEEYGDEYHWLSLHPEGSKWIVRQFMPPEKGPGYDKDTLYDTIEEARSALLDKLLMNAGTGIRY